MSNDEPVTDGRDIITAYLNDDPRMALKLAATAPVRALVMLLAWIDAIITGVANSQGKSKQQVWSDICAKHETRNT